MKKISKLGILPLTLLMLMSGCVKKDNSSSSNIVNNSSNSTIQSVTNVIKITAYDIAINKGKYTSYDFMKGVKATDSIDGDITSSITYVIKNFYKNIEVKESDINYNEDAKYNIIYKAMNKRGETKEKTVLFVIGNPEQVYDEFGNKKICWGTHFEYDYNTVQNDYKLVWSEEFEDSTTLNLDEWKYETGNGVGGWGNNEHQYYTNERANCFINDGKLVIRALEQEVNGYKYTSARIRTYGETSWKYGRFDIKAKLPKGNGSWPAIWMMPLESKYGGWPASGEIDIMETAYTYYKNQILGTTHTTYGNGSNGRQVGKTITVGETIYNEYHTYSIEWLPDKIIWYIDDVSFFTYEATDFSACPTSSLWPFDQKFFLILNVAIGGNMGGAIAEDLFSVYDVSMYIEEIKIYQSDIITNLQQTVEE